MLFFLQFTLRHIIYIIFTCKYYFYKLKYLQCDDFLLDIHLEEYAPGPRKGGYCYPIVNTYPVDSDLFGGQHYPSFEKLGPVLYYPIIGCSWGRVVIIMKDFHLYIQFLTDIQFSSWCMTNISMF